jgi:hypothetical protein
MGNFYRIQFVENLLSRLGFIGEDLLFDPLMIVCKNVNWQNCNSDNNINAHG